MIGVSTAPLEEVPLDVRHVPARFRRVGGEATKGAILLVDDDAVFRSALKRHLQQAGYEVSAACDADEGLEILTDGTFDLVLTDLKMPGSDGLEFLRRAREVQPDVDVIVITGFGNPERSLQALQSGAFWYLEKSYEDLSTVGHLVDKALELQRLRVRNRQLQHQLRVRYGFENIVGTSAELRATLDIVRRVAETDATILLLGESGVGKELIARALHYNSSRADQPFVAVNCGALPEELLESELFGHVRGAFTGAVRDRVGRFAAAHGGTLLLDEIGDMSPQLQVKLLRVLQEREFEPVGSSRSQRVDVRIVAATNQDLEQLIRERRFREDLYFRLSVVPIEVPPLRRRREDVALLVEHFLRVQRRQYPGIEGITAGALKRPTEDAWPGNIRELEGLLERLAILRREGWIEEADLPAPIRSRSSEAVRIPLEAGGVDLRSVVDSIETDLILQALEATSWNKNRAAQLLQVKRTTLVEKIRSKGLSPPDPEGSEGENGSGLG
jgi:DNA-binding NtrC family response regulator